MANQFLNAQEYANVMLLMAKNQLVTGKLVSGRLEHKVTGENGLSISVKRPTPLRASASATHDPTPPIPTTTTWALRMAWAGSTP